MHTQQIHSRSSQHPRSAEAHKIPYDLEVIPLLRAIKRDGALVAIHHGGEEPKALMAVVSDVDGATGRLRLSCKGDPVEALAAGSATVHARRGSTRIQFPVSHMQLAQSDSASEIEVELADHLLSYDRRRHYRMAVPVAEHVRCMISFHAEGKTAHVQMGVLDISEGGIALLCNPSLIDAMPGMRFAECHIQLPDTDSFVTTLEVRNVFEHGENWVRMGCAFVGMSAVERTLIRHYIDRLEYQWRDWLPSLDFVQQMAA